MTTTQAIIMTITPIVFVIVGLVIALYDGKRDTSDLDG